MAVDGRDELEDRADSERVPGIRRIELARARRALRVVHDRAQRVADLTRVGEPRETGQFQPALLYFVGPRPRVDGQFPME
jgi:hypothetical protein